MLAILCSFPLAQALKLQGCQIEPTSQQAIYELKLSYKNSDVPADNSFYLYKPFSLINSSLSNCYDINEVKSVCYFQEQPILIESQKQIECLIVDNGNAVEIMVKKQLEQMSSYFDVAIDQGKMIRIAQQNDNKKVCIDLTKQRELECSKDTLDGAIVIQESGFKIFEAENSLIQQNKSFAFIKPSQRFLEKIIPSRKMQTVNQSEDVGTINPTNAWIYPSQYGANVMSKYNFQFVPSNYEQGMVIRITLPQQINFPANNYFYVCTGLNGTDNRNLNCIGNKTARTLTLYNGFNKTAVKPKLIIFTVDMLQNPAATDITTDSFKLETFTFFESRKLDSISKFLTVSFNCSLPCKTCRDERTYCTSCQGLASEKYLLDNDCKTTCPSNKYANTLNQCTACSSLCVSCAGLANNCTACNFGYELTNGTCINTSIFFKQYYFYASGSIVAVGFLVLLIKCCCCSCKTSWIMSTVAFASIPEVVAWGCLFYLYLQQTTFFHILTLGCACGVHVVLNFIYGLTHQKMIIHQSDPLYKQLVLDYHCWNTVSIVIAFLVSFKFHLIQMSNFCGAKALSGNWSGEIWGIWNMISVTYIISCYGILMGSGAYFCLSNMDRMNEWIWWATVDVAGLSTVMTLLLLISTCMNCSHPPSPEKKKNETLKSSGGYNKLDDKTHSQMIEDALNKFPKPKPPPVPPLKPLMAMPKKRSERDFSEEDLFSSNRNRHREMESTARRTIRPPSPKATPKATPKPPEKSNSEEMGLLKQYIDFLNQEKVLLKDERIAMMKERQRLLDQDHMRQKEFLNMQYQMSKNHDMLSQERMQLDQLRRQFLEEMDLRLRQRLDDWEMHSTNKRHPQPPSPRQDPARSSQFTYTYSPEVSVYDKRIQTDLRKSQVRDMNVQVGSEPKKQTQKSFAQQTNPASKQAQRPPIAEFPSEFEDTDQQDDTTKIQRYDTGVQVSEPPYMSEKSIPQKKPSKPISVDKSIEVRPKVDKQIEVKPQIKNNRPENGQILRDSIETNNQQETQPPSVKPPTPATNQQRAPTPSVVRGPITQNQPSRAQVSQEIRGSTLNMPTEESKGVDPFTLEPIGGQNQPFYKQKSDNLSAMGARQKSENISQIEPDEGNKAVFRSVTPINGAKEVSESMIEPNKENAPYFGKASGQGQAQGELNDSLIEPIKKDGAMFSQGKSRANQPLSVNESMMEPIRDNQPHFNQASQEDLVKYNEKDENMSQIEPIKSNNPMYRMVTPSAADKGRELNESFMEPITGNNPQFSAITPNDNNREKEVNQSQIEPMKSNNPFFDKGSSIKGDKEMKESMIEPITENWPFSKTQRNDNPLTQEQHDSMIETINDNKPLFRDSTKNIFSEAERHDDMIEPLRGNIPAHGRAGIESEAERNDTMIEPLQGNKAYRGRGVKDTEIEKQEFMIEPIRDNIPVKDGVSGEKSAQLEERMIEPIVENRPVKGGASLTNDRSANLNESMIESIVGNKPIKEGSIGEKSANLEERMVEPIKDNRPANESGLGTNRGSQNDQMIEAIKGNKPIKGKERGMESEAEKNEAMIEKAPSDINKALYKTVYSQAQEESHKESVEGLSSVKPVFEKIPPQMHIKEDYEVHQTEVPQVEQQESEEEEKVPTLEEMKTQPIAKKIKKILYSDKSESSIDENMEDTPSNYNIPNGRLDGRSLGLKAALLKDKRKNKEPARSNPLGEVANSKSGKTLQPMSSGGLNNTFGAPGNTGMNLLSGQKNGSKQYLSPNKNNPLADERSTGKVNNLFQEDLPVGERNKAGKIAQQLSSSIEEPLRKNRNQPKQEDEEIMRKTTAKNLKKQFKGIEDVAGATGSGSGGEGGPSAQVLNSGRNGGANVEPYMIKTPVPQVSNKPPKLSVKRQL